MNLKDAQDYAFASSSSFPSSSSSFPCHHRDASAFCVSFRPMKQRPRWSLILDDELEYRQAYAYASCACASSFAQLGSSVDIVQVTGWLKTTTFNHVINTNIYSPFRKQYQKSLKNWRKTYGTRVQPESR